ncbi:hypothetical protein C4569_01635 [Candidatus Parcubacteria bacterium]|nr:MAG: hypothetical protein C4569_01635 [Candidatus Parcubacteria bacterium]
MATTSFLSKEIQVSGLSYFPECRWREAIIHYLFGIWGNRLNVICRPKIRFGHIVLQLKDGQYNAYRDSWYENNSPPTIGRSYQLVVDGTDKNAVEVGLASFVKNGSIKMLVIVIKPEAQFYLWKLKRRGKYGVSGNQLPKLT